MGHQQKPLGGKWTYDDENRLRYPKGKMSPKVHFRGKLKICKHT